VCWCRKGLWGRGSSAGTGVGAPESLPVLCTTGLGKRLGCFMGARFLLCTWGLTILRPLQRHCEAELMNVSMLQKCEFLWDTLHHFAVGGIKRT